MPPLTYLSASNSGNAPFSFASSIDARYDACAMAFIQASVCSAASSEPYFRPSISSASARPVTPRPIRRLAWASCAWRSSGKLDASTTLSIIRTAVFTRSVRASSFSSAASSNGAVTRRARLMEPSKHAPYGGRGCSPHGFVAAMVST